MDCPSACKERDPDEQIPVQEADPRISCTVYGPNSSENGFDVLADEWNPLVQRSRSNVLFLTHEWQTTWWQHLGKGDLWIVAFRETTTHRLVGIAPLYCYTPETGVSIGKQRLTLVGCLEVSDYLDIIIEAGHEESVYRSLWHWLNGSSAPKWDVLDLCNLPEVSQTYVSFPDLVLASGGYVEVTKEDVAPQIPLPARYASYLQDQVEKKQRHEIRRKQRRAEREADVCFYLVDQQHCLEAEVDDFIALQRASRSDKAEFMTQEMHRFFTGICRAMADAGFLRLFFLTLDGEKAATLLAFEYNRQLLLYNSGYDPDTHSQLSPGWVLLAYSIQYAIVSGCSLFDFLQGDEAYKYRFGSQDYDVMRVIVTRAPV